MNAKYSISQYVVATLVAAIVFVLPVACEDDLGYRNVGGQPVAFKLTAPDAWHGGMSADESAPTTHCTSVQALSGGDTRLYLHTVVADNPAVEKVAVSRGTPIKGTDNASPVEVFKKAYPRFSLSGICYTDDSFDAETQKDWTANFAYNQYYKSETGTPEEGGKQLLWPSHGNVCFFAFAPTVADFEKLESGSLTLSNANYKGSPTLTYTVPADVTKQVDLMTANTASATTAPTATGVVELEFGHALTAVQIKCGKDILVGTINEVTIAGVYGTGTQVIGSDTWNLETSKTATYTISQDIELSAGENAADQTHVPEGTPIAGTDTDNLTFMLLPQTLPEGANMTIIFTDEATNTRHTLNAPIAGHVWKPGTIVTYSVSTSSINIKEAQVEFSKPDGAVIPYSGVWYDAKCTAYSEITQEGVDGTKRIDIPEKSVTLQYKFNDSSEEDWKNCTEKDGDGLLVIPAQPAYTEINGKFPDKETENGTEDNLFSLPSDEDYGGETANCYLVDKAGYYSLPLVYGNGKVSGGHPNGLNYFPNHNDELFTSKDITVYEGGDAVLLWQDAPDLIDPASVKIVDKNLVFRIRKHTLAQGNAVVAVRDNSTPKRILWSWHIWVTPYKNDFYNTTGFYHSKTYKDAGRTQLLKEYDFAQYNLGWCDRHGYNPSRKFSLRAIIDMSAYGGEKEFVAEIKKEFELMEFKGSDAGDNTYYQWGRKDPMLGGIYNSSTPIYQYKKKNKNQELNEFNMENKQVFNQYKQDGYDYSFCKNPGDMLDVSETARDYASNGVTIGYAIQHPYMFVTNSRTTDTEDETAVGITFQYRNHWHKPYKEHEAKYLSKGTHIMFNAWNASASEPGLPYESICNGNGTITSVDNLQKNAVYVTKSVYDPCPPKFKVPPHDAFRGIVSDGTSGHKGLGSTSFENRAWTMTYEGQSITFPATGVRNYALRQNEWNTVNFTSSSSDFDYKSFYKESLPAFRDLTFVSSATIIKSKDVETNAYQLLIFMIDKRKTTNSTQPKMVGYTASSNSYGLAVRPIRDNDKP